MAFDTKKHDRVIKDTIEDIEGGVFDSINSLENAVADLIAQGYDPVTLRSPLIGAFQRYSAEIKQQSQVMRDIADDYQRGTGFQKTAQDSGAETILTDQTANTIGNTVEGGAEGVLEIVALGTAAGLATNLIVEQARGKISGVLFQSEDPEVRREQRKLKRMMRGGGYTSEEYGRQVAKIRRLTPTINTANSLRDQTKAVVNDGVMNFAGAYASGVNKRNGVEKFLYAGGVIETTRPFCQGLDGQTLSEEDINSIWGSQWKGKEPGDPFVVRGGYNCRHYWVPVIEEED